MLPYAILGLCLLLGLYFLARWFVAAEPKRAAQILVWTLAILGGALGLWLIIAGSKALAALTLPALLPLLYRAPQWVGIARLLRGLHLRAKAGRGPRRDRASRVDTAWLAMELDHGTGEMDGRVLRGAFAGAALGDLGQEELTRLLLEIDGDPDSVALLESYLDRRFGPDGRQAEAPPPGGASGGAMSAEEARSILGVEEGADAEAIRNAHRQMMRRAHPDAGGSSGLAAQVNAAKERLLRDLGES